MHHYMEFNILAMTKAIHKHDLIPPDVIPHHSLQLKSRPACSMCRTIYEWSLRKTGCIWEKVVKTIPINYNNWNIMRDWQNQNPGYVITM